MIIGKGIVIGINFKINSYYFLLIIVIFKEVRTGTPKYYFSEMEELTTTANKLGKLADEMQTRLLE